MSQPPGQPNSPSCSASEPRFLIRLEPRLPSFLSNVRTLLRRSPESPPATPVLFWPDVFVPTSLPWRSLMESGLSHSLMLAMIWGISHTSLSRPRVVMQMPFQHSQIVYYTASEYLPPLKTPSPRARVARPAEPALASQEIISVPPEADNRGQTIVTPPDVQLAQEMPLPNLVAWTRSPGPVPVYGSLNARLTLPPLSVMVVPPPPEIARMKERGGPSLPQTAVIQPPPEVAEAARQASPLLPQPRVVVPAPETSSVAAKLRVPLAARPGVIPPPPSTARKRVRGLSVAGLRPQAVAPQPTSASLQSEQGGEAGARSKLDVANVAPAPPPPNTQATDFGRPAGQIIALGLSPSAVNGPINVPLGNRRGVFAAEPPGHVGASGSPAANSGGMAEAGTGSTNLTRDKLAGIASAAGASSPPSTGTPVVAVPPARNLWAMANIPAGLRNLRAQTHSDLPLAPSAIDREVFGNKKFYSVTLNMPNLNSRSGSWVIRFAELNQDNQQGELTAPVVVEKVDPAYPGILMRRHVEGTVTLYAVIGADGSVGDVRILRGVDNRLDAAARDALKRCHFRPATKNGLAVALEAVIRIPFEVHRIPY